MVVEFEEKEVTVLVQLLDIATKAGGLNVAKASLAILDKLEQAQSNSDPGQSIDAVDANGSSDR